MVSTDFKGLASWRSLYLIMMQIKIETNNENKKKILMYLKIYKCTDKERITAEI